MGKHIYWWTDGCCNDWSSGTSWTFDSLFREELQNGTRTYATDCTTIIWKCFLLIYGNILFLRLGIFLSDFWEKHLTKYNRYWIRPYNWNKPDNTSLPSWRSPDTHKLPDGFAVRKAVFCIPSEPGHLRHKAPHSHFSQLRHFPVQQVASTIPALPPVFFQIIYLQKGRHYGSPRTLLHAPARGASRPSYSDRSAVIIFQFTPLREGLQIP